ncbi:MAG: hypothetical protein WA051_00030 [Minisyncoccia bacterium]
MMVLCSVAAFVLLALVTFVLGGIGVTVVAMSDQKWIGMVLIALAAIALFYTGVAYRWFREEVERTDSDDQKYNEELARIEQEQPTGRV